jgi:hypothetical protein
LCEFLVAVKQFLTLVVRLEPAAEQQKLLDDN